MPSLRTDGSNKQEQELKNAFRFCDRNGYHGPKLPVIAAPMCSETGLSLIAGHVSLLSRTAELPPYSSKWCG